MTGGKLGGEVEVDETFIGGKARTCTSLSMRRLGTDAASVNGRQNRRDGTAGADTCGRKSRRSHGEYSEHARNIIFAARLTAERRIRARRSTRIALPSYTELHADDTYAHQVIDHAECYVKGNIHTNGMENFWSLLKRTINGTYVSIEPFHLFRYLDEQAFPIQQPRDDGLAAICCRRSGHRRPSCDLLGAYLSFMPEVLRSKAAQPQLRRGRKRKR